MVRRCGDEKTIKTKNLKIEQTADAAGANHWVLVLRALLNIPEIIPVNSTPTLT